MENSKAPILYVDDEPSNLRLFERYFERDYRIFTAGSAEDARDILRREEIHLVITDQRMPGMTGVELLEAIKDDHPDIARMIVTAYSDVRVVIQAINAGRLDHYVTRPWDPDEVRIAIDRAVEGYDLRRRNRQLTQRFEAKVGREAAAQMSWSRSTRLPTILFVDDDEEHVRQFKESFPREYTIYTASDGESALAVLRTREIHVLLTAQRLRGMTGVELLEAAIKESTYTQRVLLVAYLEFSVVVQAINVGRVDQFALKPWKPEELRVTIGDALDAYELHRRNDRLKEELDRLGSSV